MDDQLSSGEQAKLQGFDICELNEHPATNCLGDAVM